MMETKFRTYTQKTFVSRRQEDKDSGTNGNNHSSNCYLILISPGICNCSIHTTQNHLYIGAHTSRIVCYCRVVVVLSTGICWLISLLWNRYFVEGMSQAMRQEVADFGVKVTCIQPGDVMTDLFEKTTDQEVSKEGVLNLPLHILISCSSSRATKHRQHCRAQW
jgi:hypothetical protein